MRTRLGVLGSLALLWACTEAEPSPRASFAALGDTLAALLDGHGAAAMRSDPEMSASIFAEDARLSFPGADDIVGRDSLVALTTRMWPRVRPLDVRFQRGALYIYGDTAFEVGSYRHRLQPASGDAFEDRGRHWLLWARQDDGQWKVARLIANSAVPPAGN